MSDLRAPFVVVGGPVRLAVLTDGEAVTGIQLEGDAGRAPAGALECWVERELSEYFAGVRRQFSFPVNPAGTPFQQRVWKALAQIPYGSTRTYGDLARAIGKPKAARAVGMANHHNPIPIVIPCHRVVAAGGKLGGYGGGVELKRRLLDLEAASQ